MENTFEIRYPFVECWRHPCPSRGAVGPVLNLGCGRDILPGWVNADRVGPLAVEKMDIWAFPWPWPDNYFAFALLSHIVEHLPYVRVMRDGQPTDLLIAVMEELYRVCNDGALIDIYTPDGMGHQFRAAPDHSRPTVISTWHEIALNKLGARYDLRLETAHKKGLSFYMNHYFSGWHLRRYLGLPLGSISEIHAIFRVVKPLTKTT